METKVNYTIVGLFVIILSIIGVVGIVWLSVGVSTKTYDTYVVYMHESVSGLSLKSPVKYNGVEVGSVTQIDIVKGEPSTVKLTLAIANDTPVTTDTRAQLDTQGLTGISFVELRGGQPGAPPLEAEPDQKYPVIKSIPSFLFRLDSALTSLSTNLNSISAGLSTLLSHQNTELLNYILHDIEAVTDKLAINANKMDHIIDDTEITLHNTANASHRLPIIIKNFDTMVHQLNQASLEASGTFRNTTATFTAVNDELLPDVIRVLENVKVILDNVKGTTQQLEQNPAVLLRGSQPLPPGPGE